MKLRTKKRWQLTVSYENRGWRLCKKKRNRAWSENTDWGQTEPAKKLKIQFPSQNSSVNWKCFSFHIQLHKREIREETWRRTWEAIRRRRRGKTLQQQQQAPLSVSIRSTRVNCELHFGWAWPAKIAGSEFIGLEIPVHMGPILSKAQ